jgi:hypothetical protein
MSNERPQSPEMVADGGTVRFDLAALYRAVDSRRLRRRLKWPDAAAEIGLPLQTVQSARSAAKMDADTVLAIVRWLGLPPETFVRPEREGPYPEYMDAGTVWRVDPAILHARLAEAREARGMTWKAVAAELGDGISTASLTRLEAGGRVSIQLLAAAAAWLDEPMATFTRVLTP